MAKFTVVAVEYKEHKPVTTEGTQLEAIRAFLKANGLDGLNLNLLLTDEAGTRINVSQMQCAAMMEQDAKDNPKEPMKPSFAMVDPVEPVKADKPDKSHAAHPSHALHAAPKK